MRLLWVAVGAVLAYAVAALAFWGVGRGVSRAFADAFGG